MRAQVSGPVILPVTFAAAVLAVVVANEVVGENGALALAGLFMVACLVVLAGQYMGWSR
jgi:hypothetical protein